MGYREALEGSLVSSKPGERHSEALAQPTNRNPQIKQAGWQPLSRRIPRTQGLFTRYRGPEEWPESSPVHQGHHPSVSIFPVASCLPRGNAMRCLMVSAQRCHPFFSKAHGILEKNIKLGLRQGQRRTSSCSVNGRERGLCHHWASPGLF